MDATLIDFAPIVNPSPTLTPAVVAETAPSDDLADLTDEQADALYEAYEADRLTETGWAL